jgi:hypothetical protein
VGLGQVWGGLQGSAKLGESGWGIAYSGCKESLIDTSARAIPRDHRLLGPGRGDSERKYEEKEQPVHIGNLV